MQHVFEKKDAIKAFARSPIDNNDGDDTLRTFRQSNSFCRAGSSWTTGPLWYLVLSQIAVTLLCGTVRPRSHSLRRHLMLSLAVHFFGCAELVPYQLQVSIGTLCEAHRSSTAVWSGTALMVPSGI